VKLSFTLNGEPVAIQVPPDELLVDVIRGLGLTGTKQGCGVGVCGVCTVLVGDRPVSSCLYLAACAEGEQVWTAEGLARAEPALIRAFAEQEGMQCGICTPGQVVTAAALAREHPAATDEQLRQYQAGTLCRCTGYQTILAAVRVYLDRR
jgi:aerobic carbon-monoxide dehydrogenase small subunit